MSWQKRSIQIILGLPLAFPIGSYAIYVGDTYVQSQQNQPLQASINVSEIDPNTFSVGIADALAYKQLGLSSQQQISVKFQPTSSNGGRILLTSTDPITTPYTDVILTIHHRGEKKLLPKTLLMPQQNGEQMTTQTVNNVVITPEPTLVTVGQPEQIELPVMSNEMVGEPLVITAGEPPPLDYVVNNQTSTAATDNLTSGQVIFEQVTNPTGSENLTVHVTRTIGTEGHTSNSEPSKTQDTYTATAQQKTPKPSEEVGKTVSEKQSRTDGSIVYVIQRNDNLWTISHQIAKANQTDVNDVMQQIIDANPDLFENGDPSRIYVNAKLEIPKYRVMPSQLGIRGAMQAQQSHRKSTTMASKSSNRRNIVVQKSTSQPKKPTYTANQHRVQPVNPPIQSTRKSEMTIIAPTQNNGSSQGSVKADNSTGLSAQMLNQLKEKRQSTADKASRVNQLNDNLLSAEKKIKLQNAKLAQLEQRLKELNKNN